MFALLIQSFHKRTRIKCIGYVVTVSSLVRGTITYLNVFKVITFRQARCIVPFHVNITLSTVLITALFQQLHHTL